MAKRTANSLFAVAALMAATAAHPAPNEEPFWAWGFNEPPTMKPSQADPPAAAPDDKTLLRVEGSRFSFTAAQIVSLFSPADWFPEDHPPMPEIVAHGRKNADPAIWACALCHLPNGNGRPENANLTGLTRASIVQQLADFRNGSRETSDKRKTNTALMTGFAKSMTDAEIEAAAAYFASIPAQPWIKVVESDTAPKTRSSFGLFIAIRGEQTEPLGDRIVEVTEDEKETETLRNPRVGFVAYVPRGSLSRGEALVKTGNGKVTACTACHGADLRGLGPVPRLAGRSPSYIARQLYDMRTGNRAGAWTPLMVPVVVNLDAGDMLAAAAYLGSIAP